MVIYDHPTHLMTITASREMENRPRECAMTFKEMDVAEEELENTECDVVRYFVLCSIEATTKEGSL